jgi:hypothetical protein
VHEHGYLITRVIGAHQLDPRSSPDPRVQEPAQRVIGQTLFELASGARLSARGDSGCGQVVGFVSSPPHTDGREDAVSVRMVVVALAACALLLMPATAVAAKGGDSGGGAAGCNLPESNAEALVILSNLRPGYWWDHTNLTIAVQAHPRAAEEQLDAIDDAIATWSETLEACFDGLITLTDVTGGKRQAADIVVHYVPTAGGVVFAGYAICGDHGCPNILVRSDLPPSLDSEPYDPEYLGWVTLHEIGHALGLGHATNLLESTDLMGYGWPDLGDPVLSDCDIDALAYVFRWAIEGTEPAPPGAGPYDCSLD